MARHGSPIITGSSLSLTVTVNVAVYGVPELSVAVTVTVVVPIGNAVPDGGKDESEATPSLSPISGY